METSARPSLGLLCLLRLTLGRARCTLRAGRTLLLLARKVFRGCRRVTGLGMTWTAGAPMLRRCSARLLFAAMLLCLRLLFTILRGCTLFGSRLLCRATTCCLWRRATMQFLGTLRS
eukprot:Rmarinus@m.7448